VTAHSVAATTAVAVGSEALLFWPALLLLSQLVWRDGVAAAPLDEQVDESAAPAEALVESNRSHVNPLFEAPVTRQQGLRAEASSGVPPAEGGAWD
jgi:hypothetical protein